jgi:hypothetical protein
MNATITTRLKAVEFFVAIVEIREWLDCNRYEPVRFKYDQDEDDVVLSVDFKTEAAASTFAICLTLWWSSTAVAIVRTGQLSQVWHLGRQG